MNIMPYLLFLKKQQYLKLSSTVNCRWRFKGYLDDILNINNVYFDNMVCQIYPSELQLNKANASDTGLAFVNF